MYFNSCSSSVSSSSSSNFLAIFFISRINSSYRGNPSLAEKLSFCITNNWFLPLIHYVGGCFLRWKYLGTQVCTQSFVFRQTFCDGSKTYFWALKIRVLNSA